jgi:hypothetical protein
MGVATRETTEIVMIIFIRHGGKNYNLNKQINTEGGYNGERPNDLS